MGRTGFATAPRRAAASSTTSVSVQFGSWKATTSPARTPRAARPPASRSAAVASAAKLVCAPPSTTAALAPARAALASIVAGVLALPAGARAVVVKDNLYGVKAMSASEAWAVGNFGSIYHTTGAGKTWEARASGTKVPLFAVDFADAEHGWIVGK